MAKEDTDMLDLFEESDVEEEGDPGPSQSRGDKRIGNLSKGLNELRSQFSELKGILLAQGTTKKAEEDEKPEFDSKEEELLWTLTQHSKQLESKVKAMEERTEAEKRETALNKAANSLLKGVDFGEHGEFAHSLVVTFMKQHPKADSEEIRAYADKVIKMSGKSQKSSDRQYAERKKADAEATKRPRSEASGNQPKQTKQEPEPAPRFGKRNDMFGKARERAMSRLASED